MVSNNTTSNASNFNTFTLKLLFFGFYLSVLADMLKKGCQPMTNLSMRRFNRNFIMNSILARQEISTRILAVLRKTT